MKRLVHALLALLLLTACPDENDDTNPPVSPTLPVTTAPGPTETPLTTTPTAAPERTQTPTPAPPTPSPVPTASPAPPTATPAPPTPSPVPDQDGDGYPADVDCDDFEPDVHPGADEVCDSIDNNCDGNVDEGVLSTFFFDSDADGFGSNSSIEACSVPDGYADNNLDCDDFEPDVHPGADEVCGDGIDQNCDGADLSCDDVDDDQDGYTENQGDCDDTSAAVHPGAAESCNGVDDDCDGEVDEEVLTTFYPDADGDGYGDDGASYQACEPGSGAVAVGGDCDDGDPEVHPGVVEQCGNEVDEDCDGVIGSYLQYEVQVTIQENSGSEQPALPVRLILEDEALIAALAAAPSSLRIYPAATEAPYAEPYAGLAFHRETTSATEAVIWVSVDLPAGGTVDCHLYFGNPDVPDVDDPSSVFAYFEDFTDGVDDWTLSSDYTDPDAIVLEATTTYYHSPPFAMRNYLVPPGYCVGAHWAYSSTEFELAVSDTYLLAFYTRSAPCGGCTMYSRVFIDQDQVHNAYDPGPELHYVAYPLSLEAGTHEISAGIYTTQMCSGTFQAIHDDFMLARWVTPEPTYVQADTETPVCR